MTQQALGCIFNQVQYPLETAFPAKVRIRHFPLPVMFGKFQKQSDMVSCITWTQFVDDRQVVLVHCEQVIESLEILPGELPAP